MLNQWKWIVQRNRKVQRSRKVRRSRKVQRSRKVRLHPKRNLWNGSLIVQWPLLCTYLHTMPLVINSLCCAWVCSTTNRHGKDPGEGEARKSGSHKQKPLVGCCGCGRLLIRGRVRFNTTRGLVACFVMCKVLNWCLYLNQSSESVFSFIRLCLYIQLPSLLEKPLWFVRWLLLQQLEWMLCTSRCNSLIFRQAEGIVVMAETKLRLSSRGNQHRGRPDATL